MLKQVNLDVGIEKVVYREQKDALSLKLGALQRSVKALGIPVLIIFEGWDAAGKGTLINDLMLPLDPRNFVVYDTKKPSYEEINRPFLWRYWTKIPGDGQMVLFDESYYSDLIERQKTDGIDFSTLLGEINDFEKTLADDGTLIIKFFIHISKKEQKKRFEKLEKRRITAWRVTKEDWAENKNYDKIGKKLDKVLEKTDTSAAPWTIIEGHDRDYACLKVYNTLVNRLEKVLAMAKDRPEEKHVPLITAEDDLYRSKILEGIDANQDMCYADYKKERKVCQKRLRELEYVIYKQRIPVVLAFEGWDAGGKGGAIKRICQNLDPRGYRVHPTAAPTEEEKSHNYLWRFWKTVPKRGHFSIYDRTWYGRLMVEPIEGFCSAEEYRRAFSEINAFEKQLTDFGAVVLKFWMQIDADEQERRFKEREQDPNKQWKITDEDWRNREKWGAYTVAVDRMLLKTSTEKSPWIIVEGNNKYYARIKVLKSVIGAIEAKIEEMKTSK